MIHWELKNGVKTELIHNNYGECRIPPPSCDECEDIYWREIHADFCDEDCPQRWDEEGGSGKCRGCTCEHCEENKNV